MTDSNRLVEAVLEVGTAVRHPEDLVSRWKQSGDHAPAPFILGVLLVNAIAGTAAYGMTMQLHLGTEAMLRGAFFTPLAAGLAWTIAFPALYIVKRLLGSELTFGPTLLAASITVSFGASAMLASVPINWFFTLALPWDWTPLAVNLVVFSGVGFCMSDVFLRVMREFEPDAGQAYAYLWLLLLAVIGAELFAIFEVFNF